MLSNRRQGLAVWLTSLKFSRQLRRYGSVYYVSKKMKYVIMYCDQDDIDKTIQTLQSLHYVRAVEPSMRPFIETEFKNAKRDEAKEYDYKMGI